MTNAILWCVVYLLCGFLCGTIAARIGRLRQRPAEEFFLTIICWPIFAVVVAGVVIHGASERYVKWIREPFEDHEEES